MAAYKSGGRYKDNIMDVSAFDFALPESAIALRPVSPRDRAKLLHIDQAGQFTDKHVFDLPNLLRAGDILVVNETRVLPAALIAKRAARAHGGGGAVTLDINLIARQAPDIWQAFARPAKRLKIGDDLSFDQSLSARVIAKDQGGQVTLQFSQNGDVLDAVIETIGAPPLPPYIARKRAVDARDHQDYQTIYAQQTGSVAAPTAGLHFTPELMAALKAKGIIFEPITLHVGAGTFLPVKSDRLEAHKMHAEWYDIAPDVAARLNAARDNGQRIIAVGTTSLRALESAARNKQLEILSQDTDIFITPGYEFQIIDGLMTNFHLPKSTLFMLVSALAGLDVMQSAYRHALDKAYRFYSYGDSSLIWNPQQA